MKTIRISQKNLKRMLELYDNFYEIYGNEKTIWDIEDVNEMCKIGQEFMDIFSINLFRNKHA
jgi:hypothetical protein